MILLTILLGMLLLGSLAQGQGDWNDQWSRVSWTGIGSGLLLATIAPNPWSSLLIGLVSLGLIWHAPMSSTWSQKVAPGLALIAGYVVASPHMAVWMVTWLLGGMATVGALTGAWALYSTCQKTGDTGFVHEYAGGWLRLVDRSSLAPLAGQGNFNHTQSVGALATACALGLWTWWALPLGLLSVLAVALSSEGRMTGKWMSQGVIHLTLVGSVLAVMRVGSVYAWLTFAGLCLSVLVWAHPWNPRKDWYDSNRFAMWNLAIRGVWWRANQPPNPALVLDHLQKECVELMRVQDQAAMDGNALVHNQMTVALQQNAQQRERMAALATPRPQRTRPQRGIATMFWCQRLRVRLLGCGTGTWYPLMKWPAMFSTGSQNPVSGKFEGMVYLSAHNELIEVWFEQGVLGVVAALGFTAYALLTAWATPVFLPVVALLSVSLLNFPFTLFATVEKSSPDQPDQFVGCPALTVMALVILLCVEAVR